MKPTNRASAAQVRSTIITVFEVCFPHPQTPEEVAVKLRWLAPAHRIAMDLHRLARDGVLVAESDDSETRYRIAI